MVIQGLGIWLFASCSSTHLSEACSGWLIACSLQAGALQGLSGMRSFLVSSFVVVLMPLFVCRLVWCDILADYACVGAVHAELTSFPVSASVECERHKRVSSVCLGIGTESPSMLACCSLPMAIALAAIEG
jgi:hypothetical protein